MSAPRVALGALRLLRIALRYRLDGLLSAPLPAPLRWLRPLAGRARADIEALPPGVRARLALEHLGPIFVKFGQILSTRRDLLPPDIADELAALQDRVAPFDGALARAQVERAFGRPVTELFAAFDETALASASIAQVHPARLHDGSEVVVKVLRPDVHRLVARDLELLRAVAGFVERRHPRADRIRPREVVAEIEATLANELDLQHEGANASAIGRIWNGGGEAAVPKVHWPLTQESVLTLERMAGIPIGDLAALERAGIDRRRLAERLIHLFYTQVFRDNLFHADLHPGNLFIQPRDGAQPVIVLLDFGMVGSLSPVDQRYLAENFMAMFTMDYRRVAQLHLEAGWMPRHIRVEALEAGVRAVCEPYFTRPLSEINLGEVLFKLFRMAQRYELTLQPQLMLLQKTLLNVEGLSRWLDPKIDIWAVAQPVLRDIMQRQYGRVGSLLRAARIRVPDWLEQVPALPRLARETLETMREEQALQRLDRQAQSARAERGRRALVWAMLAAGAAIGAAVLQAGAAPSPVVAGVPVLPGLATLIAALTALMALRRG
ncbi:MAG: 2-polyprenylphenol 6-hydroxylase [Xanthomonadales bacterium]|nr:2-polyprenylphenol 6-hydroxylase [Xanthomonadales bacterium]